MDGVEALWKDGRYLIGVAGGMEEAWGLGDEDVFSFKGDG
jgi:hypothetical protein